MREGLLHDLLGRRENRDPRANTITAFIARYELDRAQAQRVRDIALDAYQQLLGEQPPSRPLLDLLAGQQTCTK